MEAVDNVNHMRGHRGMYYFRPAAMDPDNSVDVFERGRLNEFGEPYCVHAAILPDEARAICAHRNEYFASTTI